MPPLVDPSLLEEIRADWESRGLGIAPADSEIVDLALRRMKLEIDAGLAEPVVEELRREIAFRRWCDMQTSLSGRSAVSE